MRAPIIASLFMAVFSLGYFASLEQGFTGAPMEMTCKSCHINPQTGIAGEMSLQGLSDYILAGQAVPLAVIMNTENLFGQTAGFQMTILDTNGTSHGQLSESDPNVVIRQFDDRQYAQHEPGFVFNVNNGITSVEFEFEWTTENVGVLTEVTGYVSAVLGNGNYSSTITNGQWGDSVFTAQQSISIVPILDANISVLGMPLCSGGDEGILRVRYVGGLAPVGVLWSTGSTETTIGNLPAGEYMVTVSDAFGQEVVLTHQLDEPAELIVEAITAEPTCYGINDGSISLNISGGTLPYLIFLNGESVSNPLINLEGGEYMISVIDSNGCENSIDITLEIPDSLIIELIFIEPQTQKTGGAIIIEVTGGTPNYDFLWEGPNGYISSIQNPADLTAGIYNLTVTDGNGCEAYFSAEVDFGSSVHDIAVRNLQLQLSPNPATTSLHFVFPPDTDDAWRLTFISTKGHDVFHQEINSVTSDWTFIIPDVWSHGVYLVMACGAKTGIIYTQRWVKIAE